MQKNLIARQRVLFSVLACVFSIFLGATLYSDASVVEFTAIGKVESIYRDRVSMKILDFVGSDTAELALATGSWVSFDLPREYRDRRNKRDRGQINYGTVIEADLIGNIATEYELKTDEEKTETVRKSVPTVLLWTAQAVRKVKNPNDYLPEEERKQKKGRRNKKEKKPAEPVKVWTQEETVRGNILLHKDKVYIKEDRLGKKDRGLEVLSEAWTEKLKTMPGTRVVLHGTTHRTSVASGTMEIRNLMKIYQK
ncbi:MAG TPA: hypothetical protein PKN29_07535 [Candidatus Ozemobacteraceae bacterium]|nr:hypothetical protein [Candidatus Ozemobacteraceae bacterium]